MILDAKAESALGICFPDDFKQFYIFSNGFESEDDMFNIIPLEDIMENFLKNSELNIAEYMIYGDLWGLDIEPINNNNYTIFNIDNFEEKIVLTNSLSEFLKRFVEDGLKGLYEWSDVIKGSSNPN